MKEEDKLLKKIGTDNPFTVPEGYFERLTSDVMDTLPKQESTPFVIKEVSVWDRVKPWVYMAAMFVGAALIIRVASYNQNPFENKTVAATDAANTEVISDEYIDYSVAQSMLDDYSLYVYLSDASLD